MTKIKIEGIETIEDLIDLHSKNIVKDGNDAVSTVIAYGKQLNESSRKLEDISEQEFMYDIKPDFIVIVESLERYYEGWEDEQKLIKLNRSGPNYFNMKKNVEGIDLNFKIGVIDVLQFGDYVTKEKEDLYIPGRLQKNISVVYCKERAKQFIDNTLDKIRKEGMGLALKRLKRFSYDDLIKGIIKTNYLAEAWRFDFLYKPEELFQSTGKKIKEVYLPYLNNAIEEGCVSIDPKEINKDIKEGSLSIDEIEDLEFYNEDYSIAKHISLFSMILRFNKSSLNISLKQRKTNKGQSFSYVKRKINKLYQNLIKHK